MTQSLNQQELLSRRSRRSRGRGRGFETKVKEYLERWGYIAKKVVLSGSNKKKPYDVLVSPLRLKIEAKRRMGEGIIIQTKWLDKIAPKYIVVFAAGPRLSKVVRMCAISQVGTVDRLIKLTKVEIPGKSKTFGTLEGKFVIRRPKVLGDLVVAVPFLIVHDGKEFVVQDFEQYMQTNWPQLAKESTDVGTTV